MSEHISLFATCLVDQLFPAVGLATGSILQRLGYSVSFPQAQTCCGQPAFNSGFRDAARSAAVNFFDAMQGADYIVVPSGSCAAMVTRHYRDLVPDHPLAGRTYELSQFLIHVARKDDLGAGFPHTVAYHDSCHALRELGIGDEPRRLLRNVAGLKLVEAESAPGVLDRECCGFGGTFSVKFPEVSGGMARTKLEAILKTGATHIVSADSSCLMQLAGIIARDRLPLKTIHLAEILASRAAE
jgi:L-lactate dehydrogenase complex protein LldE